MTRLEFFLHPRDAVVVSVVLDVEITGVKLRWLNALIGRRGTRSRRPDSRVRFTALMSQVIPRPGDDQRAHAAVAVAVGDGLDAVRVRWPARCSARSARRGCRSRSATSLTLNARIVFSMMSCGSM